MKYIPTDAQYINLLAQAFRTEGSKANRERDILKAHSEWKKERGIQNIHLATS